MKITNTNGTTPAGIHTHVGLVFLEPGECIDAEVTSAEAESAKMAGHFKLEGAPKDIPKPGATKA